MQAGKLPLDMLAGLLDQIEVKDPRVVLGPRAGEDAALIDFGDRYLVAKTDPITFATDLIGWYVIQVNANDLAVMGATPRWLMVTLLLPEGTSADSVAGIFQQLREACAALNITLVGGHTEITYGLPRPVAVGALLGEADKAAVVLTSGVQAGDSIVLTKGVAIEGTAILAREAPDALAEAGVDVGVIERSRELLFSPGISVVRDALVVRSAATVHAMHDPTEGGVATGLLEMATAAGVGLAVDGDRIPIVPECAEVCRALGLDPLGLIASGSLLAAVAPQDGPRVVAALAEAGIAAAEIGRATDAGEGLKLSDPDGGRDLPRFDRDELARYFGR
jgi:hydrogenase maturation factor